MTDKRRYYCKDMTFECFKCGKKRPLGDVLDDSTANVDDYAEITYPDGFNPFRKNKSDRITIIYNYYCNCGMHYDINLACNCFAVEIDEFDDCMNIVLSEYTEKEE